MDTEQFNLRISKELLRDLTIIANLLKVNKGEWVKTKLAKEIHEEKNKLLMELSNLYANSMITKEEVGKLVGNEIAEEMEFIKNKARESIRKGAGYGKRLKR
ncbi:MAG: hypothetical protein AABY16_04665 [Nanoarchaeota archaeon]